MKRLRHLFPRFLISDTGGRYFNWLLPLPEPCQSESFALRSTLILVTRIGAERTLYFQPLWRRRRDGASLHHVFELWDPG